MVEHRERPFEVLDQYNNLGSGDHVALIDRPNIKGEVKSFTRYTDTGEVVVNTATDRNSGSESIQVNAQNVILRMSLGKKRTVDLGPKIE